MPTPSHPMMIPGTTGQLPVGSVVAYAGVVSTTPGDHYDPQSSIEGTGWMLCDGRTLEAAQYPELFVTLGHIYGGEGGSFAIPDYRGVATGLPSVSYLIKYTFGSLGRMGSPF